MPNTPRNYSDDQEDRFFDTWNALRRSETGRELDWAFTEHENCSTYLCHVLKDRLLSMSGSNFGYGLNPLEFIEWHPDRRYRMFLIEADPSILNPLYEHERRGLAKRLRGAAEAQKLVLKGFPYIVTSPLGAWRVMNDLEGYLRDKSEERYAIVCLGIDVWDLDEIPSVDILRRCDDHLDPDCYPAHLPPRPWR